MTTNQPSHPRADRKTKPKPKANRVSIDHADKRINSKHSPCRLGKRRTAKHPKEECGDDRPTTNGMWRTGKVSKRGKRRTGKASKRWKTKRRRSVGNQKNRRAKTRRSKQNGKPKRHSKFHEFIPRRRRLPTRSRRHLSIPPMRFIVKVKPCPKRKTEGIVDAVKHNLHRREHTASSGEC